MLKQFLVNLRKQQCIGAAAAASRVGGGWVANGESLQKEFQFADFKEASFFVKRYAAFCTKVGHQPTWSNVYNKVDVTLANHEFDQVSEREVEVANYLNMLENVHVTNAENIDDTLSFEHIIEKAKINAPNSYNNQSSKTPLQLAHSENLLRLD